MGDVPNRITGQAVHETGIVWGVSVPYPPDDFMADWNCGVFDASTGRLLEFQFYAMRKLTDGHGKTFLNLRFNDRHWEPLPEGHKVNVILMSPSARD